MEQFNMDHQALRRLFEIKAERETLNCVLQGMRKVLPEEAMPTEEAVRAFLQGSDGETALDPQQQLVAQEQLLQCVEGRFRTVCDLLRYRQMKDAGVVSDMEEFQQLLYPEITEEEEDESI